MIYRKDKIMDLCKGKNVLHLGFIQHHDLWRKKIAENDWLHEKINIVSNYLVGIDYLADDVEIIKNEYGYEAYCADVTKKEDMWRIKHCIDMDIDVIVCGELIEHVANPGMMLDNLRMFMSKNTILIITTPNPFSEHRMQLMKSGHYEYEWLNKEHVCWYSFQTLKQLLERMEYKEVDYGYYDAEKKVSERLMQRVKDYIKKRIKPLCKELSNGLFFVAKC